jgi:hypothetical protein
VLQRQVLQPLALPSELQQQVLQLQVLRPLALPLELQRLALRLQGLQQQEQLLPMAR